MKKSDIFYNGDVQVKGTICAIKKEELIFVICGDGSVYIFVWKWR
jgi:hypothetical protein